jgi:hypothetical protein
MKVWILFESNPDDDDVVDVFASEEAALKYQREHDMPEPSYWVAEYEVRE